MSDLYRRTEWLVCVGRVCANPASDGPRLDAATWLDEHGDPTRADFIQGQLELARIQASEPERGTRAREVWHLRCWLPAWNRYRSIPDVDRRFADWIHPVLPEWRPEFRRGFVERLTLPAADWLTHADAIVLVHPIAEVELTSLATPVELSELADTPIELSDPRSASPEEWARFVAQFLQIYWPRIAFSLPASLSVPPVSPVRSAPTTKRKVLAGRHEDCPNCGGRAEMCPDGAYRCYCCGLRV